MSDPHTESSTEHLWQLAHDVRFAMVTSRGVDGLLHSRPLTTQNKRNDRGIDLHFLIADFSSVAEDVAADARVHVAYADPHKDRYVSISGHAIVLRDAELLARLWTPLAQAWFPGGLEDPTLRLLKVRMHSAEYWDIQASKAAQMLKLAKAAVTGQPPADDGSEHRRVSLPQR